MIHFYKYSTFSILLAIKMFIVSANVVSAQRDFKRADWEGGVPDGCTTITLGKKASVDGSVIMSHSWDSHCTRSWFNIQPGIEHQKGPVLTLVNKVNDDSSAIPSYNIYQVAQNSRWWDPEKSSSKFCYAYDPEGPPSIAERRREWQFLYLTARFLNLNTNSVNFPFSVKFDSLITLQKMVLFFQDYFKRAEYHIIKDLTRINENSLFEISPSANPFMPYDINKLFKINRGWGWQGEQTIARWFTMSATITQSRDWFSNELNNVVWLALDNEETSIDLPLCCSITDVVATYNFPGCKNGYTRKSGWWTFNRLGTFAAQHWGDMSKDVTATWQSLQKQLIENQPIIEKQALDLFKKDPANLKPVGLNRRLNGETR